MRCDEGEDEGNGPYNQNVHGVGATSSQGGVPVWGPVVAWKHKVGQNGVSVRMHSSYCEISSWILRFKLYFPACAITYFSVNLVLDYLQ